MALNANEYKQESKFERPDPLEAGTYPARLVQVISLGKQPQRPYKGEEKPPKDEIRVTYELVDEFLKDEDGKDIEDKPRWVAENFTMNSLDSDLAKSTKRYFAIDPKKNFKGDWAKLVGQPCMVTLICNEGSDKKVYNNVASVQSMRSKEAENLPPLKNDPKVFDIDDPDLEVFLSLPAFVQKMVTEDNLEFGGSKLERMLVEHTGGEVKPKKEVKKEPEFEKAGPEVGDGDNDW
jgi:hypothetical protein